MVEVILKDFSQLDTISRVKNLTVYELPLPKPMLDRIKFSLKTDSLSEVLGEFYKFSYPGDNKLLKVKGMGKQHYEIFQLGVKALEYQVGLFPSNSFHLFEEEKTELFYQDYEQILLYLEQLQKYSFIFATYMWNPQILIDKIKTNKKLTPAEQRIIYIVIHYITLEEMRENDYSAYKRLVYFRKENN